LHFVYSSFYLEITSKCPDNWPHFNNSCYYISERYHYIRKEDYTWQRANSTCKSMGGHLVVVESEAENVSSF